MAKYICGTDDLSCFFLFGGLFSSLLSHGKKPALISCLVCSYPKLPPVVRQLWASYIYKTGLRTQDSIIEDVGGGCGGVHPYTLGSVSQKVQREVSSCSFLDQFAKPDKVKCQDEINMQHRDECFGVCLFLFFYYG